MFAAIIIAYTLFLTMRLLTKHKILPEDFSNLSIRDPEKESIDTLFKLVSIY